jgi:putative membrane protein
MLPMTGASDPLTPLPDAQSALGIAIRIELERLVTIRTAYSSARSLKSWMRTAVSLYTFGFAVAKFFDYVAQQTGALQDSVGPRWLGLAFVALGIISLVLGLIQYLSRLMTMGNLGLSHLWHYMLPAAAAGVLTAIGIATAVGISLN